MFKYLKLNARIKELKEELSGLRNYASHLESMVAMLLSNREFAIKKPIRTDEHFKCSECGAEDYTTYTVGYPQTASKPTLKTKGCKLCNDEIQDNGLTAKEGE